MPADDPLPWVQAGERPVAAGPDGYPLYRSDPYFAEHELLNRFYAELDALRGYRRSVKPTDVASGGALVEADPAAQARLIHALVDRARWVEARREKGPRF